MNQSEQITALTKIIVDMHRRERTAERLRQKSFIKPEEDGRLAKLCGVTSETIRAWESGALDPTPTQAITWLTTLYAADSHRWRRP